MSRGIQILFILMSTLFTNEILVISYSWQAPGCHKVGKIIAYHLSAQLNLGNLIALKKINFNKL